MKYLNLLFLSILIVLAACSPELDSLTEDERVETRAAEIVKATTDFEMAVEKGIADRETQEAFNNPPTLPPATSTTAPPPTTDLGSSVTPTAFEQTNPTAESAATGSEQPTPTLFPLVKQGAPGNRQGIEGNIFAPEGLQISADPPIYGPKMAFMALGVFDSTVGEQEGAGVQLVTFTITNAKGDIVHRLVDDAPFYCAFGGNNPCTEWDFAASDNTWPNGTAAESGKHNAQIEASGINGSRFAIWTYDFTLDLGDGNISPPQPTATLFPLVKQGAPGDRQGIEGDIYAPAGLQISADPAVYGQRISFLLVDAFDSTVGGFEGDGVNTVTFTIFDSNGNEVFRKVDATPFYCAFGGDNPCSVWDFSKNNGSWPDGTLAQSGNYNAQIEAKGKSPERFSVWTYDFALDLSDPKPAATPTIAVVQTPTTEAVQRPSVMITGISLSGDRYAVEFVASGYQPVLPGMHMHFFFDTVPAEQAGAPGSGPWQIYPNVNGGAANSPMTLYGISDRPAGANQLCVLVANPNHSVNQGTGNCYALP